MSEKMKDKKKLGEAKTKEISTMYLQENTGLMVGKKTFSTEMQPSQSEPFEADPEVLKMLTGTKNEALSVDILLRGYMKPVCELHSKETLAIPFMEEMKPQNVLEGMLFSQMLSIHCVGMDYLKRSEIVNVQSQKDSCLNSAVKLLRLQHETIDSLMKLRRNGEQKVIVQHVNVNDGGQAVVNGQLTTGG